MDSGSDQFSRSDVASVEGVLGASEISSTFEDGFGRVGQGVEPSNAECWGTACSACGNLA